MTLRVVELFAGIGAQAQALENLGLLESEQGHAVHNRRNLYLSPMGQIVTSYITAIIKEMGA